MVAHKKITRMTQGQGLAYRLGVLLPLVGPLLFLAKVRAWMRQARSLWSQRNYQDCINLLTRLQREYPNEEDVVRLLETAREDQSEQDKDEKLTEARFALAESAKLADIRF